MAVLTIDAGRTWSLGLFNPADPMLEQTFYAVEGVSRVSWSLRDSSGALVHFAQSAVGFVPPETPGPPPGTVSGTPLSYNLAAEIRHPLGDLALDFFFFEPQDSVA